MDKFNILINLTRINKPIGIFLLLWPTLCGVFLASEGMPDIKILAIFILGTILMRSAGCVANDLVDRNLDSFVERTKDRPITSGLVSIKYATILLFILLFSAFALVLQLNHLTILISFLALLFLLTYPFTKRFFSIPQLYLGVTFGFGILMAFSAIQNTIPIIAQILFISNIFWAFSYDSHYAISDMEDDKKLNIHSAPLTFNNKIILMVTLSYILMFLGLSIIGILKEFTISFYILLGLAMIISMYGCFESRHMEPNKNFKAFLRNNYVGLIIFTGFFFQI
ncbi:4-hydroxybenzoate octaprenyltransferase [Methylophilaceae bacterium]|jgi:4-hydroxybenzoate polyprenyltransferase|nr:4-hydroxybenzoate octaprenyltransferase [Methylophilaceae bacterium]|tara:strand:+ start:227 stop:1072 length:846 start_codon:yes stop_codon:yes gene_type:complete